MDRRVELFCEGAYIGSYKHHMQEWYRSKTWTKTDEELFFMKLKRAGKDSRAQYLGIQAGELLATNDLKLLPVAEALLTKLLQEYPDDVIQKSSSLYALGIIYQRQAQFDKALNYFKQAIDFEHVFPNVKTNVYLAYAEMVVKQSIDSLYDIAEGLLTEREPTLVFPIDKYKVYSLLSILKARKGDKRNAGEFAAKANLWASAETSGLRYHQSLGLVSQRDKQLDNLIKYDGS